MLPKVRNASLRTPPGNRHNRLSRDYGPRGTWFGISVEQFLVTDVPDRVTP